MIDFSKSIFSKFVTCDRKKIIMMISDRRLSTFQTQGSIYKNTVLLAVIEVGKYKGILELNSSVFKDLDAKAM